MESDPEGAEELTGQFNDAFNKTEYKEIPLTEILAPFMDNTVVSLEGVIKLHIMAHLDEHQVLSDRQHSFRKRHSCETQLTTVRNDWVKILDKGGQVDTFILDFKKAFHTHTHELLKSKLFCYGIGGKILKWMDSFLCYRKKGVVVSGETSGSAPVLSGVPHRTVPGPLLISLYIYHISTDTESEIRLFADDCICYREISETDDSLTLQSDIDLGVGQENGV